MDATWPDMAAFACPCGVSYPVTRWRWVDVVARPELARTVAENGPYEGTCPACGSSARAAGTWLRIDPSLREAVLVMSPDRRGAVTFELRDHANALCERPHAVQTWLLQPRLEFATLAEPGRREPPTDDVVIPVARVRSGELFVGATQRIEGLRPREATPALTAGVPQVIGSDARSPRPVAQPSGLGAHVADLELTDGTVVVQIAVAADVLAKWESAKLDARPVHLRGRGYPILGVRVIGSYFGQRGCIDGVIDAATVQATEIFRALTRSFELDVVFVREGSRPAVSRHVVHRGLEPNAALCHESATSLLARGEYPPSHFERARRALALQSLSDRLTPPRETVAEGAYRHLIGAAEAVAALEHLDRISRKEHLSRLLEVEGLPMGEYDALRRRVLAGSLEHGLVAPRRFWRRMIASGLVGDFEDYAHQLADNRARFEGEEGDLSPEQAREAWEGILELCERKTVPLPEPLRHALDLGDAPWPPRASARAHEEDLRERLRDPSQRLRLASDVLHGRARGDLDDVFDALDGFEVDELLAILPDLSELGPRAVPALQKRLESPRRELRQTAAILLGLALDPAAIEPLVSRLVAEETGVWRDIARALGAFGPIALRCLCLALQRDELDDRAAERIARALAEIALSDGSVGPGQPTPAHDAVAALVEAGDPRVSTAARRALATLRVVSESGAMIRGELPATEQTEVRGFARRAYEAIMVPVLEVEAEA